jgi:hypothetical protein
MPTSFHNQVSLLPTLAATTSQISTPHLASSTPLAQSLTSTKIDKDINSAAADTPRTTELASPAMPSTAAVLANSASTSIGPTTRFCRLIDHARRLIRLHGPYTTHDDTTVLKRSHIPYSTCATKPISIQVFTASFAAAQNAYGSAQTDGPANEDLELFAALWKAAVETVEQILEEGIPNGESFGWGAYGLSGGYILPFSASSPSPPFSPTSTYFDYDDGAFSPTNRHKLSVTSTKVQSTEHTAFEALRQRLHTALLSLPGVSEPQRERHDKYTKSVPGAEKISQLVRARKEVHFCGTLLVQMFREDEWRNVRWGHLILVAERWIGSMSLPRDE